MDFVKEIDIINALDSSLLDSEYIEPREMEDSAREVREKELKDALQLLVRKRAVVKRKLTLLLKATTSDTSMTPVAVKQVLRKMDTYISQVEELFEEIGDLHLNENFTGIDEEGHGEEVLNNAIYMARLADLKQGLLDKTSGDLEKTLQESMLDHTLVTPTEQPPRPSGLLQQARLPNLTIRKFSGEKDREQFRTFLTQFENLIGHRTDIMESVKFQYLISHLEGAALREIVHLPKINDSYRMVRQLLKNAYLDEPQVVDMLLHKLHAGHSFPLKNEDYLGIRDYLASVGAILAELKEFGHDFLEGDHSAIKLASHLIMDKLPSSFRKELQSITQLEYPLLSTIFEKYHLVIKNMERFGQRQSSVNVSSAKSTPSKTQTRTGTVGIRTTNVNSANQNPRPPRPEKVPTQPTPSGICKFCSNTSHYMRNCSNYATYYISINRCRELNICSGCSSARHELKACPARRLGLSRPCPLCKANDHIAALCPQEHLWRDMGARSSPTGAIPKTKTGNTETGAGDSESHQHLYINMGQSLNPTILPTILLEFRGHNGHIEKVRALVDSGAQVSYVHPRVVECLGLDTSNLPAFDATIKTFLGEQKRELREASLGVNINRREFLQMKFLVDKDM